MEQTDLTLPTAVAPQRLHSFRIPIGVRDLFALPPEVLEALCPDRGRERPERSLLLLEELYSGTVRWRCQLAEGGID